MNSAEYINEIRHFMIDHKEHGMDFKILVLRLMTLYNNNVQLVSMLTAVPETVIMEWKSDWDRVIVNNQAFSTINKSSVKNTVVKE